MLPFLGGAALYFHHYRLRASSTQPRVDVVSVAGGAVDDARRRLSAGSDAPAVV